jgi:adenylate cyclase
MPAAPDFHSRLRLRLHAAAGEEERDGLKLAAKVRTVALVVLLTWQAVDNPYGGLAYGYVLGAISIFIAVGLIQYWCATWRNYAAWAAYLFIAIDAALLAVFFTLPNPFIAEFTPPAMAMRGSGFVWYFLLLMQAAFSFRPRLVLWCGACVVAARGGALLWVANKPGVFTNIGLDTTDADSFMAAYFDPGFVFLGDRASELLAALMVAGGLAVVVARSHRFVESRALAERGRANLARYFSPNVVDELSSSEDLMHIARDYEVAVLFADIVGFTRLCESEPAATVIQLLRAYHGRLAEAVFQHNGTLDKYIGDGLMATFGTPRAGLHDATDALRCAAAIVATIEDWNVERTAHGMTPVRVAVGLHYGPVIVGDIGDERRLEFAVIGDSVNVASRIEQMTRVLDTPLAFSHDLYEAVVREADGGDELLERFTDAGPRDVHGREGQVRIWTLSGDPAA